MRASYLVLSIVTLASGVVACGDSDSQGRSCDSSSECVQGAIPGQCLESPVSTNSWCAFQDDTCTGGTRWGLLAGDGLAAICVESLLDAGRTDAIAFDATVADAGSPEPDATALFLPQVSAGGLHTCAVITAAGEVRCWGYGEGGALGYGNTDDIGDNELASAGGPVSVATSGRVIQLAAGVWHTCALLEGGRVRCWGGGATGELGLGNTDQIGDDELPSSVPDVDVGGEVIQIDAGMFHTCAVLSNGRVRCWGGGFNGMLGYGNAENIGDDETPASAGDVDVGGPVEAISVGQTHTCALLEGGRVRCWGVGNNGQLGYGNKHTIGDDETPASAGDVDVGGPVAQVVAGVTHTCALLQDGRVRCWGRGAKGRLGYASEDNIGDDELPWEAGVVDVGGTVVALATPGDQTCGLLEGGSVRCWGPGDSGQLGYGNTNHIGDAESPASAGDVPVGAAVVQLSVGNGGGDQNTHACAVLTTGKIRCWGYGQYGQLGYGNTNNIGDDETPDQAGDVPAW